MQFPTQTSHWGAQGENSPIITMGAILGKLYKITYFQAKQSCEGGNNLLIIATSRKDLLPKDLSPLWPHTWHKDAGPQPAGFPADTTLSFGSGSSALLRGLRSCPGPRRPPATTIAPHGTPSCHHPEPGPAAARPMPSPSRHWLAPCTQPGAQLVPVSLSSSTWTPMPVVPRRGLSWPGGRGQQGRGSADEGAWAPAAPCDRFEVLQMCPHRPVNVFHHLPLRKLRPSSRARKRMEIFLLSNFTGANDPYKGQQKGQTEAAFFILKVCSGRGTLKLQKGSVASKGVHYGFPTSDMFLLLFQGINIRETWFWKVSTSLIKQVLSLFQREPAGIHFAEASVFSGHSFILRILLSNR